MATRPIPWHNIGIGGAAWIQLATIDVNRFERWTRLGTVNILIQCGGTTDLSLGAGAPATYANEITHSLAARAAGIDLVIGTTTNAAVPITSAGHDADRLALRTLVLADASHAFDAVVDFDSDPRLVDPTDTLYYADGTHPTILGASIMAALVGVQLDALMQTVTDRRAFRAAQLALRTEAGTMESHYRLLGSAPNVAAMNARRDKTIILDPNQYANAQLITQGQ